MTPGSGYRPLKVVPPFHRVSVKAIVLDSQQRLLVVQTPDGLWEMPGGGWEEDEPDVQACLKREFEEELGTGDIQVGRLLFLYRTPPYRGYYALRLVYSVTLSSGEVAPGQDMIGAKFVTPDELQSLNMAPDEAPIKEYVDEIWPSVEKNTGNR